MNDLELLHERIESLATDFKAIVSVKVEQGKNAEALALYDALYKVRQEVSLTILESEAVAHEHIALRGEAPFDSLTFYEGIDPDRVKHFASHGTLRVWLNNRAAMSWLIATDPSCETTVEGFTVEDDGAVAICCLVVKDFMRDDVILHFDATFEEWEINWGDLTTDTWPKDEWTSAREAFIIRAKKELREVYV